MALSTMYTVRDIAEHLNKDVETVRRWCRSGKLEALKPGGREWRIREEDLNEFMEERTPVKQGNE
jgi:excisionase family DNA binding protein